MKFGVLILVVLLVACSGNQRQTPVIVADGTEAEQFEKLFFCGDLEGFTKALADVGSKLGDGWEQVEGDDSPHECTVRINIDEAGNIVAHEIVTCDKPSAIPEVLAEASPVPVPENKCMLESINGVKFGLNSGSDSNS
ncbi:hypothetical protein [Shewanella woodyi]|uniref:Lipoprotein n=1 Tax=Shewanella woodyi (strain ATCC 51908 / MS32) TaxID=392500 RepID=B1KEL5_SHEWM|nr:hypothetical protein [Shewanella woodyi]ACA88030.1 hypothetical protein Swoo_3771 [Shewanella woodyi ATCC 51908]